MLSDQLDSVFDDLFAEEDANAEAGETFVSSRIAFVDLLFSWPPNGGADIDLFHVMAGLQAAGHEVKLFAVHEKGVFDRGRIAPETLPFPCARLVCEPKELKPDTLIPAIRASVNAWKPDMVFIGHGYSLKPYVIKALSNHRTIARYYAHELTCARNAIKFKEGKACDQNFLDTPDSCRKCAYSGQASLLRSGKYAAWTREYLAAEAYAPEYPGIVQEALESLDAIIVSNPELKQQMSAYSDKTYIFPGGVALDAMPYAPLIEKSPEEMKIILMTGRVEDPAKGLNTLLAAGGLLAQNRSDFQIWATHSDFSMHWEWFRPLGWRDHKDALRLYARADICVVPSLWDEPFGLVAVEAMAAGRPVVASHSGGLSAIVLHSETGLLFERGNAEELAQHLNWLLDHAVSRMRMGELGREVVKMNYNWDEVMKRYYIPLVERMQA